MNLFEQPVDVERVDNRGQTESLHRYYYDGWGRTVREVDARGYETSSVYDEYDRLVDQILPDGSVVHRDYAPHAKGDLPTLIKVKDVTDGKDYVMGTQTFDGLDRMIEPAKVIVPVSANAVLLARPKAMARRVFFIF